MQPDPSIYNAIYTCPHCNHECKGLLAYHGHVDYYHNINKPLNRGKRATRAPLASELLSAIEKSTAGLSGASRELGISIETFRKWAKILIPTQFEDFMKNNKPGRSSYIMDVTKMAAYKEAVKVLTGIIPANTSWTEHPQRKMRLLTKWGLLVPACHVCGFSEQRISDGTSPFVLDFIDGNKKNWLEANLRIMCYNCYYLNVHDLYGVQKNNLADFTQ